jgi:hypothetical protein
MQTTAAVFAIIGITMLLYFLFVDDDNALELKLFILIKSCR